MKTIHLVCNAHLDPVWQWEWEEGAAAVISTFRTAADLCEEFDTFLFCHNEVIVYEWVEEYEPELFARIQHLVREGRWHIMGGWYLQPDCNMPSGESFVRQALTGRMYFKERFGVVPTTALNFDPFGHTRGLVQILAKSGFDSYLHCRPGPTDAALPAEAYTWVGYDGSEIIGRRMPSYNSGLGAAREKVEAVLAEGPADVDLVLWGVGDHGGGPSRVDVAALKELITETEAKAADGGDAVRIVHSTPEAYFNELRERGPEPPRHESDINPWAVGCYTSQVRLKQKHRRLENTLFQTEKMCSAAAMQGLIAYPADDIRAAQRDLLVSQFHDSLPGSSIQEVEEAVLDILGHGLEILSRIRARAFFALSAGEPSIDPNGANGIEYPILVYNHHPFPVTTTVECEFMLEDVNWADQFSVPTVYRNGERLPCQVEKERSNMSLDWRKRPVFLATLEPGRMNRFDCRVEVRDKRFTPELKQTDGLFEFQGENLEVTVNAETGLIDRYCVDGEDSLAPDAFKPLVIRDNDDPWGMLVKAYREVEGAFRLMSNEKARAFLCVENPEMGAVNVVEDGEVRTVIEALFEYGDLPGSALVQRYSLPKQGSEMQVETRVFWNEKQRALKLSIPTLLQESQYLGQVAYGRNPLPNDGNEAVAQQWVAVDDGDRAVTCINEGIYGSDCADGEIRMTLLRSPAFTGHPIGDGKGGMRPIVPQDRFTPRIDQGERLFRVWVNAGPSDARLTAIDREAQVRNEKPFALSFNPPGAHTAKPKPLAFLSDDVVRMTAFKKAETGDAFIVRLFEPTGQARGTTLSIPAMGVERNVEMGAFEIKTLRVEAQSGDVSETDLMEGEIS